jgi:hypothetical protein
MKIEREAFLVLCAAMAACHHEAVSAPSAAAAVTLPPPLPNAQPVADADACAAIARENAARLASPRGACPTDEASNVAEVRAKLVAAAKDGLFATCRVGGGTWAVLVRDVELSEPAGESGAWCGASARWRLVFVDPKTGARAESGDFPWASFPDSDAHAEVNAVYDFDGDGRSEIVTTETEWSNGGGTAVRVEAWRGGPKVEPYPIGFPVTGTLDADGDGRPDFVDEGYFETTPPCFGLYPVARHGVPLLVHALPNGTFTMGDETSRRWARTQCPSSPTAGAAEPTVAACMRLWGKPPDAIVRGLDPKPDFCGEPKSSERDVTAALITRAPPFATLDQATPAPLPKR